jgi:hypothetical protein
MATTNQIPSRRRRSSSPSFSRHVAPFVPLALALAVGAGAHGGTLAARTRPPVAPPAVETTEPGFAQVCTNPNFPVDTPSPIDETSCSVAGNGGAETWQNEAKNNFCATGPSDPAVPTLTKLSDFVALQEKVQQIPGINFGNRFTHPLTSKAGPIQKRAPLVALGEGELVQLIGFVRIARKESAESVNCGSNVPDQDAYHDIHISIVLHPADPECAGVIAEMTPHHRPSEWNLNHVNEVAAAQLLVRVTGQRMFDSSHTPCISGSPVSGDPARISLWEVHPIYMFEVCPQGNCASGGWIPLEAWKKS